jgi:GntR family transcriptional regulator, transcriptional repressor for pyruvate dehydrogenase complex
MTDHSEDANSFGFKPVASQRMSEAIFEQIRDKILKGELKPDDRLPSERALIDIFQRSRPTIREALRMLERSGLIMTIPGSGGSVVRAITSQNVEQPLEGMVLQKNISPVDLYEFRTINETANVIWAAQRRTAEDIGAMRQIIRESEQCKNDWNAFFACDVNFHKAVVKAGHNQMSAIIHTVISQMISDIIARGFRSLSSKERERHRKDVIFNHKALLEAIIEQDAEKAKTIISSHLDEFKHFMKEENTTDNS